MSERVLIAATCAPYKIDADHMLTHAWLTHAHEWSQQGHGLFLAEEIVGGRDTGLREEVVALGGEVWRFSIDDGADELTSHNRLIRICTGRNLIHEYATNRGHEFDRVLFLDTDTEPPSDCIDRLLEADWPLVGFHVPTYGLTGSKVLRRVRNGRREIQVHGEWVVDARRLPEGDLRWHWNTAGALMVKIEAVRRLRWRFDASQGMTDDPCFAADAISAFTDGETVVRHDVVGRHHPAMIGPVEHRGHDLRLESM